MVEPYVVEPYVVEPICGRAICGGTYIFHHFSVDEGAFYPAPFTFPGTHLLSQEKPLELTMETASTMHSSREESCQPSPTAPLDARPATQPALHVQPPNLPAAPMGPMPMLGPDGLPLPNLLGGRGMDGRSPR